MLIWGWGGGQIKEIRSRGRLPILVGGTHYYTQSLLFHDSLAETESRRELEGIDGSLTNEEISSRYPILDESTEVILQRLREVDPVMADRWHPNDRRRIRRSLEIYCSTGRRASDIYEEQRQRHKALGKSLDDSSGEDSVDDAQKRNDTDEGVAVEDTGSLEADSRARFSTLILWTHTDPEDLKLRLDERVDQMVLNGLLSEVWSLNARFDEQSSKGIVVDKTRGIWISIGYKEFVPYICSIKAGDASDEAIKEGKQRAVEQTKTATRRYAKQQNRWIRIKFLHALRNARLEQKLFLLDTSDPSQWVPAVEQPAMDLAERFLAGNELPAPRTLSRAADDMLVSTKAYDLSDRRDLWVRTSCEVCGTTAVCDEDWTKHVRSRRHRRQVKRSMRPPRNSSS
ncbi:MAG: hypothetical protein M1837_005826 [Sclerophora amabilis]|nr:MAG: hypothetical protein M1837_005826 [Sclerophora amabilis]